MKLYQLSAAELRDANVPTFVRVFGRNLRDKINCDENLAAVYF